MRFIRATIKVFAVIIVASIMTRTLILSGLVRTGLETPVGNAIYLSLHDVFSVNGIEDAETMVIFTVLIASLIIVTFLAWLLAKLVTKYSSWMKNKY
ncbi:hypothetical protein [Pseudomonas syringae]|uniref:Uncharacterized protein n=1 Tax=Pseudomonas syringae pv. aceris TaxID=199198 RepID=A0A0P9H312_PSESX|nr:hypothetical protein [Pseudomonas syringae]EGH70682.1 hypothetical protein PSYAR_09001 [Pseudomonas syringae pv. aceris str. M302273]KPW12138.1 hypothetical protein ALO91_101099 [Pseudomonas syringae pv. aceris]